MSRFNLLLILLCLSLGTASAATRDPGTYFFDQFLGNFEDELQMARDEGKQGILIMFEMDECPFCHRMKSQVLNQEAVQDYFKEHFLIYAVDVEGDVEITDFQGKTMKEKDFAFKQFKVDAREFLWLGEFVVDGHYKSTNFSKYKRAKKRAAANP
ncbi:MAG: thioredoxin fold domain-containing protein [Candidatus Thiodiazotropha sp.]